MINLFFLFIIIIILDLVFNNIFLNIKYHLLLVFFLTQ